MSARLPHSVHSRTEGVNFDALVAAGERTAIEVAEGLHDGHMEGLHRKALDQGVQCILCALRERRTVLANLPAVEAPPAPKVAPKRKAPAKRKPAKKTEG